MANDQQAQPHSFLSKSKVVEKPRLFSRQAPTVDVNGFLHGLVENSQEVKEMRAYIQEADHEAAGMRQHIKRLEDEIRRVTAKMDDEVYRITKMRDAWMDAANEMQIQLEVMSGISASAAEQATNLSLTIATQSKNSIRAAKEKLAKVGLAMPVPSIHDDNEAARAGTKAIAQMFAPKGDDDE